MKPLGLLASDRFLDHRTPEGHPERDGRLRHLTAHLRATSLWNEVRHIDPVQANEELLRTVHTVDHIRNVRSVCASGGGTLDEGDTPVVQESYDVALLAAGAVTAAIDDVMAGTVRAAFCAVRPPGHHAERDRAMGFCLFNNAAIGARYAQQSHGLRSVAILDWDVHHGNGTQHIFEEDDTILYISLHQYPFYPGTGAREETGRGKGKGYTLNIPLPAGTDERRYQAAFRDEVLPALERFKPDLLMISAGFDAHRDDPLGSMELTAESFAMFTEIIHPVARIVSILEGGYNLHGLATSVEAHLRAL